MSFDLKKMAVENEELKQAIFFSHFPLQLLQDEDFHNALQKEGATNIHIWNHNRNSHRCYGVFIFENLTLFQKFCSKTKTDYRKLTSLFL